jgi:hypothetical protein
MLPKFCQNISKTVVLDTYMFRRLVSDLVYSEMVRQLISDPSVPIALVTPNET